MGGGLAHRPVPSNLLLLVLLAKLAEESACRSCISRPDAEIAGLWPVPSTGPVAERAGTPSAGPSDKVDTCSYQVYSEKRCLVVHTKQLLETLYLLRGNACEVPGAERQPPSWRYLSWLLAVEMDRKIWLSVQWEDRLVPGV